MFIIFNLEYLKSTYSWDTVNILLSLMSSSSYIGSFSIFWVCYSFSGLNNFLSHISLVIISKLYETRLEIRLSRHFGLCFGGYCHHDSLSQSSYNQG